MRCYVMITGNGTPKEVEASLLAIANQIGLVNESGQWPDSIEWEDETLMVEMNFNQE